MMLIIPKLACDEKLRPLNSCSLDTFSNLFLIAIAVCAVNVSVSTLNKNSEKRFCMCADYNIPNDYAPR